MKMLNFSKAILVALLMMILGACESDMDDEDEVMMSMNNGTASHTDNRRGSDCMDCHSPGGNGRGDFNVAGTVYQMNDLDAVYPNTTIHLYREANGLGGLVTSIEVDGNGNFYTTRDINFGAGLYPAVTSAMGTIYMNGSVTRGNCNDCHDNVTESRIFAN